MKALENKLDELLVKKAPFQLPDSGRKALASALPYLALIGGALSLLGAWGVYQLVSFTSTLAPYAYELNAAYGYNTGYTAVFGPMMWVSLLLLVVEAVLFFMAFAPLKARRKRGWDLVLWVSLLNVAYAVAYLVAMPNLFSFIFSLIGSLISLYLLFQLRALYTSETSASSSSTAPSDKR